MELIKSLSYMSISTIGLPCIHCTMAQTQSLHMEWTSL